MSGLVSCLYRHTSPDPMTEAEKDERAREAWRSGSDMNGIRLSWAKDDYERQTICNILSRALGARPKQRK